MWKLYHSNRQYGSYGELLSGNTLGIRFLYNGKYGVSTEGNGLYYMRARYYNVDIKRFLNRDVVAGNPTNPQSLNRYSYVQGNPINLLDPFGLSPNDDNEESFWGKWGHTILDIAGFIPLVGDIADVVNAVWYYIEGDAFMGTTSLISALPAIGSLIGNGAKLAFRATKIAGKVNKISECVKVGTRLISHGSDLTMAAIDVGYGVWDLYGELKNGRVDWKTAGGVVLNTGLVLISGYGTVKSGNTLRKLINRSDGIGGTVNAHTTSGLKNTGSVEVADTKARVQSQVGGSESGRTTANPKDVNFMQSSIKNQTGEHTVLRNAEALKSGTLKATDLPEIRIWQNADGKLWTLAHRRLAAFRIAELDSVLFRWAADEEVANQM